MATLAGCYSNNCPVYNTVTCNYFFYDAEGTAVSYRPAITVSAILPGGKDMFVYRRLGEVITSIVERPDLVADKYVQTKQFVRNDSILINKATNKNMLEIPMSYFNSADTLLFTYSNISSQDTIIVEHEGYSHVDLPECGSCRYHLLKNIKSTGNAIDHIEIVNTIVNYEKKENIKIYFNDVASGY